MNDFIKNGESPEVSTGRVKPQLNQPENIQAPAPQAQRKFDTSNWEDECDTPVFKTLNRQEAQLLRKQLPMVSPWRVVGMQLLVGGVCCLVIWLAMGSMAGLWSAMYGVAAAVLPNALMARGMTKRAGSPMAVAAGFMFWEMLKIGVAVAMLVIAAKVVPNLSWPALLIAMVVCIKMNWFALLWRGR